MKATETIIVREIDMGWVEGWGGLGVSGDGETGCVEGFL